MNNKKLGAVGENSAANFLIKNKYEIINRNYKTKFGEIDIIASNNEYIIFVEVKARTGTQYGLPCQAVNFKKQNVIGRVASMYLAQNKLSNQSCRFDVIEVLVENGKTSINHIKDAFQPQVS